MIAQPDRPSPARPDVPWPSAANSNGAIDARSAGAKKPGCSRHGASRTVRGDPHPVRAATARAGVGGDSGRPGGGGALSIQRALERLRGIVRACVNRLSKRHTSCTTQVQWAADLLTVPTLTFMTLYVAVFIAHGRRELVHVNVTAMGSGVISLPAK